MQEPFQITLKAARVNAGLTLMQASKSLGIGKDTLIKWEREPWRVSALYQMSISEAYNVPVDRIIFLPSR